LTQRGAKVTLDALTAGATDYVTKPANVGNLTEGINRLQEELVPKIRAHCRHLLAKSQTDSESVTAILTRASLSKAFPPPRVRVSPIQIVAIGTSTGGPNALSDLVHQLPPDLGVPIVMVQHMPPIFTKMLAERLSTLGPRRCFEAEQGQLILPDAIYLAPGGKHLEVRRDRGNVIAHLHEGPAENSCRPAVDVLFRSVVAVYGSAVLGVILTGMGQDGLLGCRRIREQNGVIVVQDQATSVVWGMPGYVAQAGLADRVLPLPQIAGEIDRVLRENRLLQPRARAA
jgi:two-component system chemotaxis response regulator CheB